MELTEAAQLLVELVEKCDSLTGSSFALMPPNPALTLLEGYKLHVSIPSGVDRDTELRVKNIVYGHGLNLTVEREGFMVYKKR